MGKLFGFGIAAIIAVAGIMVYTGKAEFTAGQVAFYLIVDAIAIAIRTAKED